MGYSNLTLQQIVSGANLQDAVDQGILIQKSAIDRTSQEITKVYLNEKVYVNPTNSSYSTSGSNQLMPKKAITPSGSRAIAVVSYDGSQFPTIQFLQTSINSGASWATNEDAAEAGWNQLEATPDGLSFIGASGPSVRFGTVSGLPGTFEVSNDINDFVSGVGISDDSTYLYAISGSVHYSGDDLGKFWRSTDGGGTWESTLQTTENTYLTAMGCSGNGAIVLAFRKSNDSYALDSSLYLNGSYGAGIWEFSLPTFLQSTTANYCAISHTGQYILVVTGDIVSGNYRIVVNDYYGSFTNWSVTGVAWLPNHCSISGDGRCMAVSGSNSSQIYTSTDWGSTWSASTPLGGINVTAGVAVSFNGELFAALGGFGTGGAFATSTNGTTWTYGTLPSGNHQWSGIAM